jgi:OFA family oxalate/formate antiporter-like MFS transporter
MVRCEPTGMSYRWILIAAAFVIMMVISIYQYSWFLFAYTLQTERLWDLPTIGLTFTVFAYTATFVQPLSGFIADAHGPRRVAIAASCLVGLGLILASYATTPHALYVFYGLGGLGVGVLYGISTACAIKWFPERRGLATGLVVFGFGAGTALFNGPIQGALETQGLRATFMGLGLLMMIVLIPLSILYRYPQGEGPSGTGLAEATTGRPTEFRPLEMVRTHQWFLIYFSFTVTVSIVLIFGAHMKMLAQEFDLPENWFHWLLVLFPLGNGLSRVMAGTVSDRIGRERTMMIFYSLLGVSIICLVLFGQRAMVFVSIVLIASLLGGAPFSLYPATIGDYYGARHSTANYGMTYTAKAWAGLIAGWLSGYLAMKFGSYKLPLLMVALSSLGAAVISSPRVLKAPVKDRRS